MATQEALTLDGLALNDGVTFGMVEFDAPVPRQRQDWVGAADSETQLLVRNPLHENRKITARLAVLPQASMDVAHDKLLLVLDKLQKASKYQDGIALTWTPATGTRTATFDVLSAEIVDMPVDWENGWLVFSPQFTVEMVAKPYWRGTETLTSTATASTPAVTIEVASVPGDVPALGRLIVTDAASQSRRHVEWGLEGPLTYNSSAGLTIDSDSLVTSGFAGFAGVVSGAYDPNGIGNNTVGGNTYAGQMTALCGTGNQSHIGVFRVKARVLCSIGTEVRFTYQTGDGPMQANDWVVVPVHAEWREVDLGTITIPPVVSGTQRWTGRVDILHRTVSGAGFSVDYLMLIPTTDGYGKARASYTYSPGVISGYDAFTGTTAAVALNARVASLGGTWATSGDATDLVFADTIGGGVTAETVVRSVASAETNGRYAILGSTNYTDTQLDIRMRRFFSVSTVSIESALIARWTDANNHLRLTVDTVGSVALTEVIAGVATTLTTGSTTLPSTIGLYLRLRLIVFASGRVIGQFTDDSGTVYTSVEAKSANLATAGTLATGKPGFRDRGLSASAGNRYYDDFAVSTPAAEPVIVYSGRNMQVRHDDVIRQDSSGTYTGRPASYRGSRFLLPVGTSRVLVKARRNDIETTADNDISDSTTIQVGYTPRGLAVPR